MEGPERRRCLECEKAARLCVCARVPRVENRTRVLLLQHPRERRHALGTARLLRLGLAQVDLQVAWHLARGSRPLPFDPGPRAAVLWPAPGATPLAALPPEERPDTLVVLDGTWHQARVLHRQHPALAALPAVRLDPTHPSRYRLRREPAPHCLSTVEAVVESLRILEPGLPGLTALLGAFDSMIDDQLVHVQARVGRRELAATRSARHRLLPRALVEETGSLVLAATGRGASGSPGGSSGAVEVALLRAATGEVLLTSVPGENLEHGAPASAGEGGKAPLVTGCETEPVRPWDGFLRAGDVLATWNHHGLAELERLGILRGRRSFCLRAAWSRQPGTPRGGMRRLLEESGHAWPESASGARARLAATAWLSLGLLHRALGEAAPFAPAVHRGLEAVLGT